MEDFIGLYYPLFPPRCCTFEASQRVLRNARYSASYFSLQIRTLIVPHSTQSVNPERVVCAGAEEEFPPRHSGIAPGRLGTCRSAHDALALLGMSGLEGKVRAVCPI